MSGQNKGTNLVFVAADTPSWENVFSALSHDAPFSLTYLTTLDRLPDLLEKDEGQALLIALPLPDGADLDSLLTLLGKYPKTQAIFASDTETSHFHSRLKDDKRFHSLNLDLDDLSNLTKDIEAILDSETGLHLSKTSSSNPEVLQAILDLAPTLLIQFDLDALLQRIVEEAVNLLPLAEAGSLLMLAKDNFVFRGVVGYPESLKEVRLPQEHPFAPDLKRGEVLHVGQIADQDKQLLPPEVTTALHNHEQILKIEDTLLAPLLLDDQLIGYLSVDAFEPGGRFNAADTEALRHLATLATIAIRNARLLAAERKAHRLSETLQHLGTTLASSLDLDKVLNGLLEALVSFIDCDLAYVMLVDGDKITVEHWQATSPDIPAGDIASLRYTLSKTRDLRTAVENRQPVLVPDSETYPGWVKTPGAEWMRSHLTTPLFHEEDLIGFLNVAHAQPNAFDEQDCHVMASLAPMAAVALRNAQLFEAESRARRLSEAIQKLGMHLTQTLNESDIIQKVAEQIPQLLNFHTFIVSFREEGEHVVSPYHQGLRAETAERLSRGVSLRDFPLWEEIVETQEGIIIPNTGDDHRWIPLPGLAKTSALIVPLRSETRVIGFLTMTMDQLGFYTPEHQRILQSFADLLVVALNNARHHEEARQRVAELEALRKLDIHISTLNEPGTIIEAVVTCATDLTDIDGAAFFRYEPSKEAFVLVRSAGVPKELPLEQIPFGMGATGRAWERQEPVLIPNYQTWERQVPNLFGINIHSLLALPVTWHQDTIGVLTVYHANPGQNFSPGDVSALQLLTQQLSANLYRANLFQILRRDRDRLAALTEIDQRIIALSETSEEVLKLVLGYAVDLLNAPKGFIALIHETAEQEITFYSVGLEEPTRMEQHLLESWSTQQAFHKRQGLDSYVILDNSERHPGTPESFKKERKLGAVLVIPLWIQGQVQGIMSLIDPQTRQWKEGEIELGRMLARQASIALEKALMAQTLQRRLQGTERLNRILATINATLERDEILRYVCQEVQETLAVPLVWAGLFQDHTISLIEQVVMPDYPPLPKDVSVDLKDTLLLRRLFNEGKTFYFSDVQQEIPRIAAQFQLRKKTRALLLVPVSIRGEVIGFLAAEDSHPRPFMREEIASVESIAAAIGPTLDNARLYKETQAALRRAEAAYADLQRLDAMKSQFIQNVSHELRTPLAIVKGYVDLILDASFGFDTDPVLEQSLVAIQTHTNRLVDLVESVTMLEDLEAGALESYPQPLLPVLIKAVKSVQQQVNRHNLKLVLEFPAHLPKVDLDPQRLGLALWHLLDNAIKFNQEGGRIWVKAWKKDEEVYCEICDEGIGISQEEKERIFDRFYQVDGTTKRKYGGMGLGLSLVKEVVEKHNGYVEVESAGYHQGSCFRIILPIHQPQSERKP